MTGFALINYYIIKRSTGVSYDPYEAGSKFLIATSNRATENNPVIINVPMLIKGLKQKKYRLVAKN